MSRSAHSFQRRRIRARRAKTRRFPLTKIVCACIGVAIISIAVWYVWQTSPVHSTSQERISITVQEGSSLRTIADVLYKEQIIRSSQAFLLYMRFQSTNASLQAGSFILSPSMSLADIVHTLQSGKAQEIAITIPEGYTVQDIDALLADKGIMEPGEVLDCARRCDFSTFDFLPHISNGAERGGKLEGYLFPDTYFVETGNFVPKFFLERMLGTFRKRVVIVYANQLNEKNITLHELITMASLVEKESRKGDERPVVAGILWKRINEGMRLDADASVRYILNKPTSAITKVDLQIDSPYNSRKYGNLPPAPIASPGIQAIEASLNPKKSNYYYYLHAPNGQIHYATTNYEHNLNKQKYLY